MKVVSSLHLTKILTQLASHINRTDSIKYLYYIYLQVFVAFHRATSTRNFCLEGKTNTIIQTEVLCWNYLVLPPKMLPGTHMRVK